MTKPTRFLGVDYGLVRVGLALSDERKIIASPLKILPTEKKLESTAQLFLREIEAIEKEQRCTIEKIIIGLPLRMSGKQSLISDEVKMLADLLREKSSIEIVLWDERLSTVQAERTLKEFQLTRKRRAAIVDTVCATIILQSYLDASSLI